MKFANEEYLTLTKEDFKNFEELLDPEACKGRNYLDGKQMTPKDRIPFLLRCMFLSEKSDIVREKFYNSNSIKEFIDEYMYDERFFYTQGYGEISKKLGDKKHWERGEKMLKQYKEITCELAFFDNKKPKKIFLLDEDKKFNMHMFDYLVLMFVRNGSVVGYWDTICDVENQKINLEDGNYQIFSHINKDYLIFRKIKEDDRPLFL